MKIEFYPLKVKEVKKETTDAISILFDVPSELVPTFKFSSGQYLTLRTQIGGEEVRRSYSLCSAPFENCWKVAVKEIENGKFSSFANNQLKAGDILEAMPPLGNFTLHPNNNARKNVYVAFAAGSGITPILSLVKSVLFDEPESHFILFYGNKTMDTILFKEELQALKDKYLQRLEIHHILSRETLSSPLFNGHIDADKLNKFAKIFFIPSEVSNFYLCGPEEMTLSIRDALAQLGVASSKIHLELFITNAAQKIKRNTSQTKSVQSAITVIQDGNEFKFPLDSSGKNILDAALANGADLPFACKGGVCCTCKAKLLSGKVSMDVNYSLEEDEVAEGYILTCQSHPTTDEVLISFDI
ncbi:MAG: phenylacetate-CoA oxygenase/reductase subunit PaaK [Saprospiraceae bacterium]|nr:phenylacetate-CoA oxygenase/reductase subunit PaaK [Saprospiraceae bacterium]